MPLRVRIPDSELQWRFSRSSGPGGQNVNTTDTRVEVLWSAEASSALTESEKARLVAAVGTPATFRVVSSRFRSQWRNRIDAHERLERQVSEALAPRRTRRRTRPTRASLERRLRAKRVRSARKRDRQTEWD